MQRWVPWVGYVTRMSLAGCRAVSDKVLDHWQRQYVYKGLCALRQVQAFLQGFCFW